MKRILRCLRSSLVSGPTALLCLTVTTGIGLAEETPIEGFHVAQETYAHRGVLVSRPKPLDQRIHNLMALNKISSLDDYARWLKENLRYQKDEEKDVWTKPQETLLRKSGDCEDYAFLTSAVARVLGYRPHLLALVRRGRGHAICTFKYKGKYVWFDNWRLKKTTATSLPEFARQMIRHYKYNRLLELDTQTNRWHLLDKKS